MGPRQRPRRPACSRRALVFATYPDKVRDATGSRPSWVCLEQKNPAWVREGMRYGQAGLYQTRG